MSFYEIIEKWRDFDYDAYLAKVSDRDIVESINKSRLNHFDFLNLLSPLAQNHLEEMARKANQLTKQYFGNVMGLYAPLYVANHCINECIYCGFCRKNKILRSQLSLEDVDRECRIMAKTGVRHALLLTGEAPKITTFDYVVDCVRVAKKHFPSVSVEIQPMGIEEYAILKAEGVDGLTVYQETYNEEVYKKVHLYGPKADYRFRLDTPERGAKAGIRSIGIGPLYGLHSIVSEAFLSAMHADYLDVKYPGSEISISLPRINAAEGDFEQEHVMNDKLFVQVMMAFRLFLPRVGINVSTRETAEFRDQILPLGVTRVSAGSSTEVGGYDDGGKEHLSDEQFEISDARTWDEVKEMLESKGYQAVSKDWELIE